MKPNDYKFKVGDRVINVYGEVGHVTGICFCESCKKRGFDELTWVSDDNYMIDYITNMDAEQGFTEYYQIGEYKFEHEFNKGDVLKTIKNIEDALEHHKQRLAVIEELEKERD